MKIEKLIVGPLQTNCYFLINDNDLIIVDPGEDFEDINAKIDGRTLKAVLLTHDHFDHVGALDAILNKYGALLNPEKVKGFNYEVIKTPGHSKDSICFYFEEEKIILTGDCIFKNTFGRTDLEGGSNKEMIESIKLLEEYPDDICIYPGHGPESILGEEKRYFTSYYKYLEGL